MPSPYYKLRGVEGVSGGQFTDVDADEFGAVHPRRREPSLTDSINQRVVGSRFQEVNRDSTAFGRLPIGSQIVLEKNGQMGPAAGGTGAFTSAGGRLLTESPLPDTAPYHPQATHTSWDTAAFNEGLPPQQWWMAQQLPPPMDPMEEAADEETQLSDDWVDVLHEDPEAYANTDVPPMATTTITAPLRLRPRPPRAKNVGAATGEQVSRESFPLRSRGEGAETQEQPPPHLRIQPRAPFVRPLSGLDLDGLGQIYNDISVWRAKLKSINGEISEVQRESYADIADGVRVKGWLMVGRGLRYVRGVQLIEGRAKEDIRWDELQCEGGSLRTLSFWVIVLMVGILLGIGRKSLCCSVCSSGTLRG